MSKKAPVLHKDLPVLHKDLKEVFVEIVNIGLGKAAAALSDLTELPVQISAPSLEVFGPGALDRVSELESITSIRISQSFTGRDLSGHGLLVLNKSGALRLAVLLMGEPREQEAFGGIEQMALLETGNIMIGSVVGTLGNMLSTLMRYDLPRLQVKGTNGAIELVSDIIHPNITYILLVRATLCIGETEVSGNFILLFEKHSYNTLCHLLENHLILK